MGHIFISYSERDTSYAHGLAKNLRVWAFGYGLMNVWTMAHNGHGKSKSNWTLVINAFILIMTPRSFESDWMQSELQRAKRKLKPIFPLLLEGDEPWLSVESTPFYDVRGGGYPDSRFYSALKRVATSTPHAPSPPLPKRLAPLKQRLP